MFFRMAHDDKMNEAQEIENSDCTVYWSTHEERPRRNNCEGSCSEYNMKIEVTKLGAREFLAEYIYFGLFSRGGNNVRLGCSFDKDLYS